MNRKKSTPPESGRPVLRRDETAEAAIVEMKRRDCSGKEPATDFPEIQEEM